MNGENVLLCWGLLVCIISVGAIDYGIESNVKELIARRKSLEYMKHLLEDMDNQLSRLHKRSCSIHLPGMDCDYGDITGNGKDENLWTGGDGPGKRRRSTCDIRLGNPEGCLRKLIDGDNKDVQNWGNPDGPGRK